MQHAIDFRIDTKTREQATYEVLRKSIIRGRWTDEDHLVASKLALELGVSRITVANAMKRLASEGFILLEPHKEAVVAPFDRTDIRQIYLMRAELEALSAREAAARTSELDIQELRAINDELGALANESDRDVRAMRSVDLAFHRRLRTVAGMPLLASTLDNLADRSEGYRARLLDSNQIAAPTTRRHFPIIDALTRGDTEAAGQLMHVHVTEGLAAIMVVLDHNLERS